MVLYDSVAHERLGHRGPFWVCEECHPDGLWLARRDFGIAIRATDGQVVMTSLTVHRLLVP